jgi:hypothetical protein
MDEISLLSEAHWAVWIKYTYLLRILHGSVDGWGDLRQAGRSLVQVQMS